MKWVVILSVLMTCHAWGFDPMAPPGYQQIKDTNKSVENKQQAAPAFVLRQIVIKKDRKSAVINGYVVNEGGYIKGARVTRIEANKVILEIAKKQKILRLEPNIARIRQ